MRCAPPFETGSVRHSNDPKRGNFRLPSETPPLHAKSPEPRESWSRDIFRAKTGNIRGFRFVSIADGECGESRDDGGKMGKRPPRRDLAARATNEVVSAMKRLVHSNSRIPASRRFGRSNAGVSSPRE